MGDAQGKMRLAFEECNDRCNDRLSQAGIDSSLFDDNVPRCRQAGVW